jgi:hypothetical protein
MPAENLTLYAKWIEVYGSYSFGGLENEMFNDIIQDSDNNFIAVGSTYSSELFENLDEEQDGLIVKFNENFEIIWFKNFNLNLGYNESIYSIHETSEGDYILIGDTSNYSGIILRISKEGEVIWKKEFNYFSLTSIVEDSSGNFLVAGSKHEANNLGITKLAYIKIDTDGILMEEKVFDDLGHIRKILTDEFDNIFILGYLKNQNYEGMIKKINNVNKWISKRYLVRCIQGCIWHANKRS